MVIIVVITISIETISHLICAISRNAGPDTVSNLRHISILSCFIKGFYLHVSNDFDQ